ncbi:hypothetical protein [Salinispora arenicola]|uniref:hypothetical protein n=1 Tax=Salinispora arenicola TaxID=168697 RepID=UPI000481BA1D|nr:hypothetical protein [Salinispora arenicola]
MNALDPADPVDAVVLRHAEWDAGQPSKPAWPLMADAAEPITVPDLGCGHLPGEPHDEACAYWRGVSVGTYPPPEMPVTLPPHCPGLLPLTDPALREVAR